MPTIDAERATLYYESHGDGPALVFAHGGGGNAAVWFQQVPHFMDRYRVITFDHRGFGRSVCDPENVTSTYFADDLCRILDDAEVDRAVVVSQSMGGWTAILTAAVRPERIAGAVLGNTPGPVMTEEIQTAMASIGDRVENVSDLPRLALAADLPERDPALAFLYRQLNALNPPLALDTGTLLSYLDTEALAALDLPITMIVTDGDMLLPATALRSVAPILGAKVVEITGSGHSPYFERPDEFNAVVEGFLTEIRW